MQGVRRGEHLPAQPGKAPVQGLRRGGHLPAQHKEHVQGVRRGGHLPAQTGKEQAQDVQSRQGRRVAARSRGALALIQTRCTCEFNLDTRESNLALMHL